MIYLDNAATTLPKPESVGLAMQKALSECGNSGRSGHQASLASADALFSCREKICKLFGQDDPEKVVFTFNATHALNIAIHGFMSHGGHCLISGYEHNSVIRPLHALADKGVEYTPIQTPLFHPELFLEEFEKKIQKGTVCAICTHVSNVFGYILPISEINEICFQHGIPLIIDASQSAGCLELNLKLLPAAAAICAPGHKGLYGPQGTGVLILNDYTQLPCLMQGGTGSRSSSFEQPDFLPDRHEIGTQNVHGIAGLSAGIDSVLSRGLESIFNKERELIDYATKELSSFDRFRVFSGTSQSGVLSFVDDTYSADEIAEFLAENGIAVRGGLHCSPMAHQTVGTVNGSVRISVSDFNHFSDIDALIKTLRKF